MVKSAYADHPFDVSAEVRAKDIARRVVVELGRYLSECDDPIASALSQIRQRSFPSPIWVLATEPSIDTLSMFTEARVNLLRARHGRTLPPEADIREQSAIFGQIEQRLSRRYLRHIRSFG